MPFLARGAFRYNVGPERGDLGAGPSRIDLSIEGLLTASPPRNTVTAGSSKSAVARNWKKIMAKPREFKKLVAYLQKIPAMSGPIHWQRCDDGTWSVGFSLALEHPLAWSAVQELAYVLNTLSVSELLPTRFLPTAPPPYLNGPACWYLGWRIESTLPGIKPDEVLEWLEGRLPQPVDDESKWIPSIVEDCESPDDGE